MFLTSWDTLKRLFNEILLKFVRYTIDIGL